MERRGGGCKNSLIAKGRVALVIIGIVRIAIGGREYYS